MRGESRPGAARAVDDDLAVLVGHTAFDLKLQQAPRQMEGSGQGSLVILVRLADI